MEVAAVSDICFLFVLSWENELTNLNVYMDDRYLCRIKRCKPLIRVSLKTWKKIEKTSLEL